MTNDPREAKLPKWVQAELERLRSKLDDLAADFEEYADKEMPDDAVAVANPYDEHPRLAARKGEQVQFKLGGYRHVIAEVDPYDGSLVLQASQSVRIEPLASNHVRLIVPTH
ncbi:DUF7239 family protein [Promicromonospora kroppenstedtii]|uniref:DUF7239 family protein n=1 Tax=Promicromonospora kroppenstedtii TaxID=440482 RepID=UPI0004B09EFF|nr:hypothetical protein [Promicromonospora kroppenstedtii]